MIDSEYVIFDMDGLLIDSEKIYTDVTNEILAKHGVQMTWEIKSGLMGKPDREAALHLLSFFPNIPLSPDEYLAQRTVGQDAAWPTVPLMQGVKKLVQHLHKHGIPMAVATGTNRISFPLKTSHLQEVFGCFEGRIVCGDDREKDGSRIASKPSPEIFLVAAREQLKLDVGRGDVSGPITPEQKALRGKGLIFEDATLGMQAGKRAGMSVVWVPDAQLLNVEYTDIEKPDLAIKSLEEFVPEQWGLPPY